MLLNIPCGGLPWQPRIIQPEVSILPRLRNLDPEKEVLYISNIKGITVLALSTRMNVQKSCMLMLSINKDKRFQQKWLIFLTY